MQPNRRACLSPVSQPDELTTDLQRRDALLWNFTALGEAAAQLEQEPRGRFPEIPLSQPARLRNRVIQGYWSIDLAILHTTSTDQLPAFIAQLRGALDALAADD